MPRIYVVAEYCDSDPSNLWVVDLDKCDPEHAWTKAVLDGGGSIAPEYSLTYGSNDHALDMVAISVSLPAYVLGTAEIYIDDNMAMPDDDEDTSDDGGFENEES